MHKIYRIKTVRIKYLAKKFQNINFFFDENETKQCSKHKLKANKTLKKKLRRKKLHAKNQNKNFWNKIKRNKLGKGWKQNPGRKNELKFCLTFFTELQKQKFMYKIYRIKNVCIKYLAKILEHKFF